MQLGKMYLVKEYYWFMFPTKELAEAIAAGRRAMAALDAAWCRTRVASEDYNCNNVSFVEENTYVVLLEQDNDYIKILDSNGNIGWIVCWDFSDFFELVKE